MESTPREAVFQAMELLPSALIPFVEERLDRSLTGHWRSLVADKIHGLQRTPDGNLEWDQAALLKVITFFWKEAFASASRH